MSMKKHINEFDDHEALLDAWAQARYPSGEPEHRFARDGVIAPDEYQGAARKLLFILKDPSTSDHDGDLREWTRRSTKYHSTWFNIARWAQRLLGTTDELVDGPGNRTMRVRAALQLVAVINLKKNAFNPKGKNGTANELLLHTFACRDRHFINRQIDLVKPETIIGCGVTIPLLWVMGLEDEGERIATEVFAGQKAHCCVDPKRGIPILLMPHPGARGKTDSFLEQLAVVWSAAQSL